jgi:hypothetical protein
MYLKFRYVVEKPESQKAQFLNKCSRVKTYQLTENTQSKNSHRNFCDSGFLSTSPNLDPYLKKIIHEQSAEEHGTLNIDEEREVFSFSQFEQHHLSSAQFLFTDTNTWSTILRPLPKMSVEDICELVERSNISPERIGQIVKCLNENNINGLALNYCDLDELKATLMVS